MTGRELIIYILSNNLEDEQVIKDGRIVGFVSAESAAVNIGAGIATIKALITIGDLEGYQIGDSFFLPKDVKIFKDPGLK